MKANEFVKKFGVEKAKELLNAPSYTIDEIMLMQAGLRVDDLERLVESHELINKHSGLVEAKDDILFAEKFGMNKVFGDDIDVLKQAIADVESCQ